MRSQTVGQEFVNVKTEQAPAETVASPSSNFLAPETLEQAASHHIALLLRHLPLVTYVCRADGDFGALHCSGSALEITGFDSDAFIRDSSLWVDRLHPDDRPHILSQLNKLFINNYHVQEYRWRRRDDTYIWFMDLLRLVRDDYGLPAYIVGAWFDVTEKKQTERELLEIRDHLQEMVNERTNSLITLNQQLLAEVAERHKAEAKIEEERQKLRVTLSSIAEGVIATDSFGQIVFINPSAEHITKWLANDALGQGICRVFHSSRSPYIETLLASIPSELTNDAKLGRTIECTLTDKNGAEHLVEFVPAVIRNELGQGSGLVVVFRDVENERRIEAELRKAQKLESVGLLAGGIAHDFNNLLTGILGNISLAKAKLAQSGEPERLLETAEKAGVRAKDLTEQLLTFSKGGKPVKRVCDVGTILRDTLQMSFVGSHCSHSYELSPELWHSEVDDGQICQVFSNLLLNAQQASNKGGHITVEAVNVYVSEDSGFSLAPGEYLKISIKDCGRGIPEANRDKIFDPYFTTKDTGTGLGLTTAYSIVKNHRGQITVESNINNGSVFSVYLPAYLGPLDDRLMAKEKDVRRAEGKILVVDDEELVRDTASSLLSYLGYSVLCVANGDEALLIYKQHSDSGSPFTLVIVDLTIPGGIGGKELVGLILAHDPKAKVAVSSGYSNDPIMANYRDYGFCGCIPKPYRLETFSHIIAGVHSDAQKVRCEGNR